MQNSGHFPVTLTTGAQRLGAATGATGAVFSLEDGQAPVKWVSIQSDAAATGAVYVGFVGSVLSTTNYAWLIPAPVTSIPSAPSIIEGVITSLDQIVVLGGAGDKIHVGFLRD